MVERNVGAFDLDVAVNQSYVYTRGTKFSSVLSNRRMTDETHALLDISNKTVLDVGCGDGTYTVELLAARPLKVLGFDASRSGIDVALKRKSALTAGLQERIDFMHCDVNHFTCQASFDVIVIRGLLHHLYEPEQAIAKICRWGKEIIVIEPNGYNPVLKLIEKLSDYHRRHEEKSYCPHTLRNWFLANGCKITTGSYIGLVPMFCPDPLAKALKKIEPWVERTSLLRSICCGQYVFKAVCKESLELPVGLT